MLARRRGPRVVGRAGCGLDNVDVEAMPGEAELGGLDAGEANTLRGGAM